MNSLRSNGSVEIWCGSIEMEITFSIIGIWVVRDQRAKVSPLSRETAKIFIQLAGKKYMKKKKQTS